MANASHPLCQPWSALSPSTASRSPAGSPPRSVHSAFYRGLFGWETSDVGGGRTVLTKEGQPVAGLAEAAGSQTGPPSWTTYLATSDIDQGLSRIEAEGGAVLQPAGDGWEARTALARDASGAVFELWQSGDRPGMALWEEFGALMWSENFTPDVEQAKQFYAAVFGLRYADPFPWHFGDPATAMGTYTMFATTGDGVDQSNAVGSLGQLDPHDPVGQPHWMPCFATSDVTTTSETAEHLGGRVLSGPYDTRSKPSPMPCASRRLPSGSGSA
ncbi:VOC family protein [Streptomyces sp. ISL-100]|uniref:VOC family protein n=1 Tax=Streptomyces sp. ISL-100 TaxID=2819173 RepID=UPI001BE9F0D1|nr:VOC family protein [Streptomyces sp. ISL-100]MBT2401339.1 VOC family protein [Streptomyces sp. ISL-100]